MNQDLNNTEESDMLGEYDFRDGVRGKYVSRFPKGSSVIVLEPDIAGVFPDSESVNRALRTVNEIIQHIAPLASSPRRTIIPTEVRLEVWARDRGKCAVCGATDELHFDHAVPWSKGGTLVKAANVQLVCSRHNLSTTKTQVNER
jgi:5-methylcytosine-specific restriction endonuclease McrA